MELAYSILGICHFFISIILVISILLQKSSGSGLFTSSTFSSNSFMSSLEMASTFVKISKVFGLAFMINTLTLATLGSRIGKSRLSLSSEQEKPSIYQATEVPPVLPFAKNKTTHKALPKGKSAQGKLNSDSSSTNSQTAQTAK